MVRLVIWDTITLIMTSLLWSRYELTKYTPYLALMGNLWSAFVSISEKKWK